MGDFLCPYDAWEPWATPDVLLLSGPDTVVLDPERLDDMPEPRQRVGFIIPK